MLRLPIFEHHAPQTVDQAVKLLAKKSSDSANTLHILAGGTDLLPNLKHEIYDVTDVLSLKELPLKDIEIINTETAASTVTNAKEAAQENPLGQPMLRIGALCSLEQVATDDRVNQYFPALADACLHIAGPHHRRMGTLGGNICLDTRCVYINQTHFWRNALGYCIKKDGTECHVVTGGKRCVAAASNDSILPLWLYGAELQLVSQEGARTVTVPNFFINDGTYNKVLKVGELLTHIDIPIPLSVPSSVPPSPAFKVAYEKLRQRQSIDYPLLVLAVGVARQNDRVIRCEVVVSGLGAKPKALNLTKTLVDKGWDEATWDLAADRVFQVCRPLTNISTDPKWRRQMVKVLMKRALKRL